MDLLERKLSNSICFVMIYMKFFDYNALPDQKISLRLQSYAKNTLTIGHIHHELLRGIVNHSNSESQLDSDRNIVNNRLRDTNCYEVLEKYEVRLE